MAGENNDGADLDKFRDAVRLGTLEALKQYDTERAEWDANVAAQNKGNGNGNGGDNDDRKPAPSFAERLLGGSGGS